ncbi:hydrogenase expression/formation protein HypE [Lutibacter sp.]|uniref:hydrogenase expression/formation protein HypE n=1 Tax=Lutibacter sp. TaxID=1925666 RepID=UPI0027339932|nr:hydrogenase expression/formation protein HypE [Lutibacter sp.]MDP3313663.1 hydrogenase expression/formation protein HypE [Lutibacter sp.]
MNIEDIGFETINLGHGSGGELTRNLLDKIIFTTFSNPYLDQKHDGSIVEFNSKIAISTDSFVITPIFFKGGNIGELAVYGTVNDVAMCGAIPKYLSLAFIIEEGLKVSEFIQIVQSIKKAADESDVLIITGDTKVVERGKGDKIFINTTGFGEMHPKANISVHNIKEGDKILVNGYIAQHGMAIMSEREGLQFESSIESDSTNLNFLVKDLLDAFGEKIKLFRDPTRGGLGTVLHEIANDISKGIFLKEKFIPLEKQVAAACEMLGLDPMYVANEGVFLVIIDPSIETEVLALMRSHEKGKNTALIGEITNEHPNKVVMESLVGGKRIVSPLVGEQLPRIC